mmetsp:Transcript_160159/g.282481  ORF Transcript_160159/g.282481 Transcript_160159/m.282481 type:complete len:508 (+) Transcript_160159:45-1568(+)
MPMSLGTVFFISLPCLLFALNGFLERGRRAPTALPFMANMLEADPLEERADKVRQALQHLWRGYKEKRWGADEVKPISGESGVEWGGLGMLILDTLDTLWLAGLETEFAEGRDWVAQLNLEPTGTSMRAAFCEITWRGLGGLLSAYALSRDEIFLEKAKLLGDRLLQGFYTPNQGVSWPSSTIDVHNVSDVERSEVRVLASVGAHVLEFDYLTQASGDNRFQVAADNVMENLMNFSESVQQPLAPVAFNTQTMSFQGNMVTVSALGDAYFEYLFKRYLQSGCKSSRLLSNWKSAMEEMREALVRKTPQGYTIIADQASRQPDGGFANTTDRMQHLSCFWGGTLALASVYVPKEQREDWWLDTGAEITRTCYEAYRLTTSGLAPESWSFDDDGIHPLDSHYRLRPETLESLFLLHRITGDTKYRDWAWEIFSNIDHITKTNYGFAAVTDVMQGPKTVVLEDSEETFMGAETLKYALLAQLPVEKMPLDYFVFSTEAHPFPVPETCKHE